MRFVKPLIMIPLIMAFFCQKTAEPPAGSRMLKLMSDKSVRVYSVTRISYVNNQLPPSLMLTYETRLPLADSKELRDEVREVFLLGLQAKADSSGDIYAMVKASAPLRGPRTAAFTYSFNKTSSGRWLMREPGK